MNRASSRHLSHDFEAYKGLSLRELFWIVIAATSATCFLFVVAGMVMGYPLALGCIGFLVGFILSITACPKVVAKHKTGKPHGYLMKKTIFGLSRYGLRKNPYFVYQGVWQKSRLLGKKDV